MRLLWTSCWFLVGFCSVATAFPRHERQAEPSKVEDDQGQERAGLMPSLPSNPLSSGASEVAEGASSGASGLLGVAETPAETKEGGGLMPSLPSNPLSGGMSEAATSDSMLPNPFGSSGSASGGGLITQPLAVLGGFSMLIVPLSGLTDMMSQFQQLMGGMGTLPTMPPLPTMPSLPTMPPLPTLPSLSG